jgi:hypothetical protein
MFDYSPKSWKVLTAREKAFRRGLIDGSNFDTETTGTIPNGAANRQVAVERRVLDAESNAFSLVKHDVSFDE